MSGLKGGSGVVRTLCRVQASRDSDVAAARAPRPCLGTLHVRQHPCRYRSLRGDTGGSDLAWTTVVFRFGRFGIATDMRQMRVQDGTSLSALAVTVVFPAAGAGGLW